MNCEGVPKVVQAGLVSRTICPEDPCLLPDALKGFFDIPDAYSLTIALDKKWRVVVLCIPGLMSVGYVLQEILAQCGPCRDQSGCEKLAVPDSD